MPLLEAEILLVSHDHYDHNNIKAIKGSSSQVSERSGKAAPFLITEPGEYEIKDVFVRAIPSFHDNVEGRERGKNLIFALTAEGLRLCHMGDFGQKRLTDEQLDKIGSVDILMIPVGGVYTIDGPGAQEIIAQIEPKIVIPMHYALPKLKIKLEGLDKFLKAMGQKALEPQRKLKVQKKDLPEEGTQVVVLEPHR